ncbi:MAG: SprT family zinc-dependent metalloprotease [Actinomycetota bacterium]|nr:SprT family zinc-dependent metalloprotease [Actinomycetota bacterium]
MGRQFAKPARVNAVDAVRVPAPHVEMNVQGIRIELLRKEIKNLHLRVYPPDGRVRISVPRNLPLSSVVEMIEQRIEWIHAQQLRVSGTVRKLEYLDGETHWFRGSPFRLRVIENAGCASVEITEPGTIELRTRQICSGEERRKLLETWYRGQVRLRAAPMFERWTAVLDVEFREWRVRKMSTRWGSCNVRERRIWLSLDLAKKSDECLEYVVVHELVHLLEPGHGPRFVDQMDRAISNWRDLKRKLNTLT